MVAVVVWSLDGDEAEDVAFSSFRFWSPIVVFFRMLVDVRAQSAMLENDQTMHVFNHRVPKPMGEA